MKIIWSYQCNNLWQEISSLISLLYFQQQCTYILKRNMPESV